MAGNDITIYDHPNHEMKSFLMPEPILPPRVEHFGKPLDEDFEGRLKPLGVIGGQVIKDIMAISGVRALQIKPKEIRVKKAVSVSWQDIQERVLDILRSALRRRRFKIVKNDRRG